MGSLATTNPNSYPWMPNAVFKDCSQGICSFYCPQWCSIIYPPPPPPSSTSFSLSGDGDGNDSDSSSSSFQLSPLIVALIGVLASAFVLVTYYTIISRFCNRRRRIHQHHAQSNDDVLTHGGGGAVSSSTSGLDETLIRSITVRKYTKGDGIVDCSVCLSEFQESESVRLLPKCNHAFHIPCIDTWLRSHSSCPLCRSNIVSSTTNPSSDPPSQEASAATAQPSVNVSVSALQFHHRDDDTVIVIQGSSEREIEAGFGGNSAEERNNNAMLLQEANSCSSRQGRLLVADVLRAREDDDDDDDEEIQIGSSKGK